MRIAVSTMVLAGTLAWAGHQVFAQQGRQAGPNQPDANVQQGQPGSQAYQAFRPNTGGGEQWRYRFHNGQWWYWLPDNRWVYWRDSQWINYDPDAYRASAAVGEVGTSGYGYYDSRPNYGSYGDYPYYGGPYSADDLDRREAFGRGFGGGSGFGGGIGGMRDSRESFDALGFGGGSGFAGGLGGMRGEPYSGPGYAGGSGFAGGIVGMDDNR